jgi:hypothetical protein
LKEFEAQFPDSILLESEKEIEQSWIQKTKMLYYFYAKPMLVHYKLVTIGFLFYFLGMLLKSMIFIGDDPFLIDSTSISQQENKLTDLLSTMQKNLQQLVNSIQD